MAFKEIFKDSNDYNEKSVIGFMAFLVMVFFALFDLVMACMGKPLIVNVVVYNSFQILVLGSFGISGAEKIFKTKISANQTESVSTDINSNDNASSN